MGIRVNMELDGVYRKFGKDNIIRGRRMMANQMLSDMHQYVPRKEGILRMNATIAIDGSSINYHQPYASRQYHNQFQNYTTAGTGPKWDEVAKARHGRTWERQFMKGADF